MRKGRSRQNCGTGAPAAWDRHGPDGLEPGGPELVQVYTGHGAGVRRLLLAFGRLNVLLALPNNGEARHDCRDCDEADT
jgi:hypothetical protein